MAPNICNKLEFLCDNYVILRKKNYLRGVRICTNLGCKKRKLRRPAHWAYISLCWAWTPINPFKREESGQDAIQEFVSSEYTAFSQPIIVIEPFPLSCNWQIDECPLLSDPLTQFQERCKFGYTLWGKACSIFPSQGFMTLFALLLYDFAFRVLFNFLLSFLQRESSSNNMHKHTAHLEMAYFNIIAVVSN